MLILVCGDKYCDLKYENCSNCPIDCNKCPLKPVYIGLITTGGILLFISLIGFGLVSQINENDYLNFHLFNYQYFKIQEQRLLWDPSWIIDIKEVQRKTSNDG